MTVREKIIDESIAEIEKRLDKINFILNGNFLSDLIELRKEAHELIKNKSTEEICEEPVRSKIKKLAKEEQRLLKLAEKSNKNFMRYSTEQSDLEWELNQLRSEKWRINKKF